MTARQYMHKIKALRRRIRLLSEQIERDYNMASGVTAIRYDKDVVQTSPVGDRMTNIVAKIIETTGTLEDEIHKLQIYEEELIGLLLQLDEQYERILIMHYLDGVAWSDVADKVGYERQYIYEMRDKALTQLDEILQSQTRTDKN